MYKCSQPGGKFNPALFCLVNVGVKFFLWECGYGLPVRRLASGNTDFCVEALEEAIAVHGAPEIFNTDQGSQFTSEVVTNVLKRHDIRISMDGKGQRQITLI